jgi:hypothetical protein
MFMAISGLRKIPGTVGSGKVRGFGAMSVRFMAQWGQPARKVFRVRKAILELRA